MNFSAAEYTRQVQEAAAYIKEKLGLFYKRFCASQFKRVCAPECAVITDVTLSGGAFAMPGDMGSKTFLEAVEAISV